MSLSLDLPLSKYPTLADPAKNHWGELAMAMEAIGVGSDHSKINGQRARPRGTTTSLLVGGTNLKHARPSQYTVLHIKAV